MIQKYMEYFYINADFKKKKKKKKKTFHYYCISFDRSFTICDKDHNVHVSTKNDSTQRLPTKHIITHNLKNKDL